MLPYTNDLIQNTSIEIQRAKNLHKFRSWVYVVMAIGNLVLSIPLAIQFGEVGSAIATSITFFLGNGLVMNLYNHKEVGLDMIYFWKEIFKFFPAFIIPIIYGIIVNMVVNLYSFDNLLIFGLIYVLLYFVSMWTLGLNEYEKNLVKSPFK